VRPTTGRGLAGVGPVANVLNPSLGISSKVVTDCAGSDAHRRHVNTPTKQTKGHVICRKF